MTFILMINQWERAKKIFDETIQLRTGKKSNNTRSLYKMLSKKRKSRLFSSCNPWDYNSLEAVVRGS